MIKSSLPPILTSEIGPDSIELRLLVAADLEYFNGHFPEQAVLPGVTQLDWAVRLGCEHFGYNAAVANLEVLKFQQLILPGQEVTLVISHNAAKEKLTFAYSDGDHRYASGRISFANKQGDGAAQ
ncbi:thioester dehydrase [Shewanella xiamenensis]|uniref:ApeI family dehydratase n=1 Tax=Shewanella xiamenensis TaxID=332186 RepID=UPI00313B72A0